MNKDMHNSEGQDITEKATEPSFSSLSKRTEKIVTALYLVTDCLEYEEPLREKLRTLGVDLLSLTTDFSHHTTLDRGFLVEDAIRAIQEIATFTRLAGAVGSISEMNASILMRELRRLEEDLRAALVPVYSGVAKNAVSGHFLLGDELFQEQTPTQKTEPSSFDKGQQKPQLSPMSFTPRNAQPDIQKEDDAFKKTSRTSFDIAIKNNRRTTILKLIKDKRMVSIKDICSVISDCSEKTIQRELGTLVDEGVLKRIGERRWSQYALV